MFSTGQRVTGHEFHRTAVEFGTAVEPAWLIGGSAGDPVRDGAVCAGVHAGYLHTHPAGQPAAIRRFVEAASARV